MRQDRKNTNASGASITTHMSGRGEHRLAERGEVHAPMQGIDAAAGRAASAGSVVTEYVKMT